MTTTFACKDEIDLNVSQNIWIDLIEAIGCLKLKLWNVKKYGVLCGHYKHKLNDDYQEYIITIVGTKLINKIKLAMVGSNKMGSNTWALF